MNAETMLRSARKSLLLSQPFFASLALQMKYVSDKEVDTMAIDGKHIFYNPEFVTTLSIPEVAGVIAHEIMHITNLHHLRGKGKDHDTWNKACDYAINPILLDANFQLPESRLYDKAFAGKTAEEIFHLLPAPINTPNGGEDNDGNQSNNTPGSGQQQSKPGNEPGNFGEVMQSPDDTKQAEADIKQMILDAATIAKAQGNLPEGLERLIQKVLAPHVAWEEVFARFLTELSKDDYSFKHPNPRFTHLRLFMPVLRNQDPGKIVLIIDTSGSVNDEILATTAAELEYITGFYKQDLQVIYVDTAVTNTQIFEPGEPVKLEAKGGGGTSFVPGFTYIDENEIEPVAVIYLTDGYCDEFPTLPDYPVLWMIYGGLDEFEPPFGEVVFIQQ